MFKYYGRVLAVFFLISLLWGCAPPREKPNEDATNTGGSDELDQAINYLQDAGLALDINALKDLGKDGNLAATIFPDPNYVAEHKDEINQAITSMENTLAQMDDPNSFQAAYVHLYLGYAYVLSATAELNEGINGAISKDTTGTYTFDSTKINDGGDGVLDPGDISDEQMQSLLNTVYLLTGESYTPDPDQEWGEVTGPTVSNNTNAIDQLQSSVDLIGEILPDSNPEELAKIKDDINNGASGELQTALTNWGLILSPPPSGKLFGRKEEE